MLPDCSLKTSLRHKPQFLSFLSLCSSQRVPLVWQLPLFRVHRNAPTGHLPHQNFQSGPWPTSEPVSMQAIYSFELNSLHGPKFEIWSGLFGRIFPSGSTQPPSRLVKRLQQFQRIHWLSPRDPLVDNGTVLLWLWLFPLASNSAKPKAWQASPKRCKNTFP